MNGYSPTSPTERAVDSKQTSRWDSYSPTDFFAQMYHYLSDDLMANEPAWVPDSRKRDRWLSDIWKIEPHLAGVVYSVVSIDKNRTWSLIGGRNQVSRYTDILLSADNGDGWRQFMSKASTAYHTSDMGTLVEVGRFGKNGPLRAIYSVDPTACVLTGNRKYPLEYQGVKWRNYDFFRVAALPSFLEEYHDLGTCAVSRSVELTKLMYAIYQHDLEKLGAQAPKGLLLLQNITQDQWKEAMVSHRVDNANEMRNWFGGVAVLAQVGFDSIDAKLVALSQLPDGFDLEVFTEILMYGYALCFGYDPIEFWPVGAGVIGRGRETEIQHLKATGKGGADFAVSLQERLNEHIPEAVTFTFEHRDAEGLMADSAIAENWAQVIDYLYQKGEGVLSREQALSLLAEHGIVPEEWSRSIEEPDVHSDSAATSLRTSSVPTVYKERLLENRRIHRALETNPDEPIFEYIWPEGRTRMLWKDGKSAYARYWRGYSSV